MTYLDIIKEKKTALASRGNIDEIISQLKEIQRASLINKGGSTVVLTDGTDMGKKMSELGDKIESVLNEFKNDSKSKYSEELQKITSEIRNLATYNVKVNKEQAENISTILGNVIKAFEKIKMPTIPDIKPVVNVPKNDFSPIAKAIESLKVEKTDISDYMAHDLMERDGIQYVGFVNPSGSWMIIENDINVNKMRYVFGNGNYEDAFKKAGSYQYTILSEAI